MMSAVKTYTAKTARTTDPNGHVPELNYGEKSFDTYRAAWNQLVMWADGEGYGEYDLIGAFGETEDEPPCAHIGDFKYWIEIR